MISFLSFITEDYLVEKKKKPDSDTFNESDAKGKLFEVLAGSFLKHGVGKDGLPKDWLASYRNEESQETPESLHANLKKAFQSKSRGHIYNEVVQHARESAENMRKRLAEDGHTDIQDVVWSSNRDTVNKKGETKAGDHQNFTGEHDPNSDADIIVKTNKGFAPISLKYGENKNTNLRNNGLGAWEKTAGLKAGELTGAPAETLRRIREVHGIKTHDDYKAMKAADEAGKLSPADKKRLSAAEDEMLNLQKNTASKIVAGLSKKSGKDLLEIARGHIAPQQKFAHYRYHAHVEGTEDPNSVRSATPHFDDVQSSVSKTLDDFDPDSVVVRHGGGVSYGIYGKRKGSSKEEPIVSYGVKKGSGLHNGINTTATAPALSKPLSSETQATKSKPAKTKEPPAPATRSSRAAGKKKTKDIQTSEAPAYKQPKKPVSSKAQIVKDAARPPQRTDNMGRAPIPGTQGVQPGMSMAPRAKIQNHTKIFGSA